MLATHVLKYGAWRYARNQPLGLRPGTLYKTIHEPYFFGYVDQQLVQHYGQRLVESGGLRVQTTIDPTLQRLAEHTIAQHLPSRDDPASALVAIDPRNGKVRAMAVWVPEPRAAAVQPRHPGPPPGRQRLQTVHARGRARARHVPLQLLQRAARADDPRPTLRERHNQPWDVHNNADETAGTMNLIDATAYSVNTIFAQLVSQVGPDAVVRMAHRLGIESRPEAVLLDHARHTGGQPARDDRRRTRPSPTAASGTTRKRSSRCSTANGNLASLPRLEAASRRLARRSPTR